MSFVAIHRWEKIIQICLNKGHFFKILLIDVAFYINIFES